MTFEEEIEVCDGKVLARVSVPENGKTEPKVTFFWDLPKYLTSADVLKILQLMEKMEKDAKWFRTESRK